ncbi:MAG: FAA hydrolase family protein [Bdellovibrio sp. CG10_big_fil_rev_8_21_14_0_10_47_8]|nr:MAG: FAA hydrolase family protein [Bdellovibrio sp. CG10_big_fil_rev_8_21_14_0_10_47_8]
MIRNIWAIGRNYADHAKEMGATISERPMIFLKAGSSASVNSTEIILPYWTQEVHHEVELALKLSPHLHIIEGAVALDLTERNLQSEAKKQGTPWTLAKSFHNACAVSAFFMIRKLEEIQDLRLRLWVNDELRQEGRTSQMIHSPAKMLSYVKEHFPVCPGDLLLTGTPSGVGPLRAGDRVKAEIEGQISHTWTIQVEAPPATENT